MGGRRGGKEGGGLGEGGGEGGRGGGVMPAGRVSQRVAKVEGVSGQEYLRSAPRQKGWSRKRWGGGQQAHGPDKYTGHTRNLRGVQISWPG